MLTQIVACVLFVLLVVALGFLLKAQGDLKKAETSQSLSVERDQIRADCTGPQGSQKAACVQDLQDLSDTLSEFTKSVGTPGSSASGSGTATSTPVMAQ